MSARTDHLINEIRNHPDTYGVQELGRPDYLLIITVGRGGEQVTLTATAYQWCDRDLAIKRLHAKWLNMVNRNEFNQSPPLAFEDISQEVPDEFAG